jgi:hypothetical protein
MYLGLPGFTELDNAIERWRTGQLDWLILSRRHLEKKAGEIGSYETKLEVPRLPETSSGYVLLHRPDTLPLNPQAENEPVANP